MTPRRSVAPGLSTRFLLFHHFSRNRAIAASDTNNVKGPYPPSPSPFTSMQMKNLQQSIQASHTSPIIPIIAATTTPGGAPLPAGAAPFVPALPAPASAAGSAILGRTLPPTLVNPPHDGSAGPLAVAVATSPDVAPTASIPPADSPAASPADDAASAAGALAAPSPVPVPSPSPDSPIPDTAAGEDGGDFMQAAMRTHHSTPILRGQPPLVAAGPTATTTLTAYPAALQGTSTMTAVSAPQADEALDREDEVERAVGAACDADSKEPQVVVAPGELAAVGGSPVKKGAVTVVSKTVVLAGVVPHELRNRRTLVVGSIVLAAMVCMFVVGSFINFETTWVAVIGAITIMTLCTPKEIGDNLAKVEFVVM